MEATLVPPRSAISYLWPHNWHTSSDALHASPCRGICQFMNDGQQQQLLQTHSNKQTHTHTHTLGTISLFCVLLAELFVCRFSIFSLSFFIILLPFAKWRQMSELLKSAMVNKNSKQRMKVGRGRTAATVRLTQSETEFLQRPTKHITLKVTAERAMFKQFLDYPFYSLKFMRTRLTTRIFQLSLLMSICFVCSSEAKAKVLHTFVRASIINLLSSLAKCLFSFNFAIKFTPTHTQNSPR